MLSSTKLPLFGLPLRPLLINKAPTLPCPPPLRQGPVPSISGGNVLVFTLTASLEGAGSVSTPLTLTAQQSAVMAVLAGPRGDVTVSCGSWTGLHASAQGCASDVATCPLPSRLRVLCRTPKLWCSAAPALWTPMMPGEGRAAGCLLTRFAGHKWGVP